MPIVCTTASASFSIGLYVVGLRRSAFCHDTDLDQGGGLGEDVTDDQTGSPDRLMETTVQPRATALLQIREPKERRTV